MSRAQSVLFYAGGLLGLLLALYYADHQILTGDQTQMLYKGYLGAYQGTWLSYGNAASAVGNVPGSLSAYLIGLPLLLWDSPYAPMALLLLLRLVSYLLLDRLVADILGTRGRFILLVAYWLNPWFLYDSLLYNPAYLCLFAALHCWSAYQLRQRPSLLYSALHLLSIGLAMQLHYSWPLLAVISLVLFYRRLLHLNPWGLLLALGLLLLSLLPYLQTLLSAPEIAQNPDPEARARYLGWGGVHVYPVLKAISYWLRYGTWLFSNKLVNGGDFAWVSHWEWLRLVLNYGWKALIYGVGAASAVLVLLAHRFTWQRLKGQWRRPAASQPPVTDRLWLALYALAALVAVVVSAVLSPIVFSYWHLILVFPFALFPLLLYLDDRLQQRPDWAARAFWLSAAFCLLVNLVAATDSRKFSYQADYRSQTLQEVSRWQAQWASQADTQP